MKRTLFVASLSSLVLLLPSAGKVHSEPVTVPIIKPKSYKPLVMPAVAPVEPLQTVEPPAPVYVPPAPVIGCGSDSSMAYIYQRESGCNTASINASSGACGLGQALPCSKMGCSLSDWACQDAFFTNYAIARYGSTYNAYLFWLGAHWW